MAWIRQLPVEGGSEPWSRANIMRAMSLNAGAVGGIEELSRHVLFGGSRLTRAQEELIITTTAGINGCFY